MTAAVTPVALEWATQFSTVGYVDFEMQEAYWSSYVAFVLFHCLRNDMQRQEQRDISCLNELWDIICVLIL